MDSRKKPFLFIIWEDLADHEGAELRRQLNEYPIIIANRIAVTAFRKAEQIYEIVAVKNEMLPVEHINQQFGHKLFGVQLQKVISRTADNMSDNGSKKQKIKPNSPPTVHPRVETKATHDGTD
ncbi:hypothetical protein K7X08_019472 [Anisodus acutangulus]|uniref:Uncharacterized protein n=1 Tax=Anisodus acutangulus TaxID=402998 RepID=A0A9Q1MVV7_9SOLA|nr:hypothetical protein K7X08_019472 [Anisodus acutangulus]